MDELDFFDFDENDFDDSDFDFDSVDENVSGVFLKPKRHPSKKVKFENAKQLALTIGSLRNERYYTIIDGSFIFGDFIFNFITTRDFHVKTLTIATLSMSLENIVSLGALMEKGYVKNLNIIISDFFYSHERHNLIQKLYEICNIDDRFQLSVCRSHTKICLIEVDRCTHENVELHYTIHGSANLRASDNIEQFELEEDFELYDFNFSYFSKIIDRYKTVKKSIKSKELTKLGQNG